jgi:hypothetical protein
MLGWDISKMQGGTRLRPPPRWKCLQIFEKGMKVEKGDIKILA